jgi:hypothetical protein
MASNLNTEVLRQRLDALVKDADAAKAKADAARHVQATAAKGLLPAPLPRLRPTWSMVPPATRHSSPPSTSGLQQCRTFANW